MEFKAHRDDDVLSLELLAAYLDAGNVGLCRAGLELYLQEPRLILDLSRLDFIDSSGLGTLLWLQRQQALHGGSLKLAGMQPTVLELFRLVRMGKQFALCSTAEEALAEFRRDHG